MALSLETWRRIVAYHPLHFWQLFDPATAPVTDGCMSIVREYSWQSMGAVGRDEIRRAIASAEQKLLDSLGYAVGARAVTWADRPIGRGGLIRLPEGRVQALGTVGETLLGTPAIVLSDADGDGLVDTFTATLASALTTDPAGSLVPRFAAGDQVAGQRDDWRIWPARLTTALNGGGTYDITVRGPSAMLIRPQALEGVGATLAAWRCQDPASYVSTIALWQQTLDTASAVTIGGTTMGASLVDARRGLIQLSACGQPAWCGPVAPRATVAAVAGDPLGADGELAAAWQPIVARLAAAEISGQPCACAAANAWLYHWQFDISRVKGGEEEFAFKEAAMNNPFGTRRGHVSAWLAIRERIQPRGFSV